MCTENLFVCQFTVTANLSLTCETPVLLSQMASVSAPLRTIMSTRLTAGDAESQLGQVCWCLGRREWL